MVIDISMKETDKSILTGIKSDSKFFPTPMALKAEPISISSTLGHTATTGG